MNKQMKDNSSVVADVNCGVALVFSWSKFICNFKNTLRELESSNFEIL